MSINPELTNVEVFDIITNSADKVGGYTYTNGRSNELGFGRLNAYRAVSQAIAIQGPDLLCTSADYKLGGQDNLPSDWNVIWSVSPSNIVTMNQIDDYVNLTAIGKGYITISANLQTANPLDARIITKEVWVGAPDVPVILGPASLAPREIGHYFYDTSIEPDSISYLWHAEGLQIVGDDDGPKCKFKIASGLEHIIYLQLYNGCQENGLDYVEGSFTVLDDDLFMTVFPNPANETLSISIEDKEGKLESSTDNEYRIYDNQSTLKKIYKTKQNKITLNVSDLQIGTYIINVIHKGKSKTKQLVISR